MLVEAGAVIRMIADSSEEKQYYRIAVYNKSELIGYSNVVDATAIPETPVITSGYQVSQKKAVLYWSPSMNSREEN